jgi:hypothetical protein
MLKTDKAASTGDQSKLTTSFGLSLWQHCVFKRFVSYLHVYYDALICEINYTASSINKHNFLCLFCNLCRLMCYCF